MAGNKNSGRRSDKTERVRYDVINKAWDIMNRFLEDPNIPMREKIDSAAKVLVKSMPTQITGDENAPLIIKWQS